MSSDALALSVQGVSKGYRIPIAHAGVRSTRHSFVEALPYPFGRPQKRDFAAGVDRFLDTPVKRYSSGMYVRLAFAVAAHLNPDILLIDEVLSVGDAQFQKKSLGKMEDASTREGRTVLFVSHNMTSIESFCKRCIYLEEGRIAYDGETLDAIERYLSAGRYGVETEIG